MDTMPGTVESQATDADDPLDGASLYDHVKHYDALGEHRTGSLADNATSQWIADVLLAAGFDIELQEFSLPQFEPSLSSVEISGVGVLPAYPVWPVVPVDTSGISAPLAPFDADDVAGKLVVVPAPFFPNASLETPIYGDAFASVQGRGAVGILAITEGQTGEIIALNNKLDARRAEPALLVAGRDGPCLMQAARDGHRARLICEGVHKAKVLAHNVIARRQGRGRTIVVSTPKSGWFQCAGERGSGLAIFLGLARWLREESNADLLFVATSGHEFEGYGGRRFLAERAPPPEDVRVWLHIGANAATMAVNVEDGELKQGNIPLEMRWLVTSGELVPHAARAFAGVPGYSEPHDIANTSAAGELAIYRDAHYAPVAGIIGANILHHTPSDRATIATGPDALEPVARGLAAFLASLA